MIRRALCASAALCLVGLPAIAGPISAYPPATTPLTGAEQAIVTQHGVTKSATAAQIGAASVLPTGPALPHAANNTALSALAHTAYATVVRDGYAAAGDAPPLTYTPSASPCSLNSGAGDGGSQVPTSDGDCWNASFPAGVDPMEFGQAGAFQLYASASGASPAGNDQSGKNWCLSSAHPCLTVQNAVNHAALLNFKSQWNYINIGAGTFPGALVSGPWIGGGGAGISGQYLVLLGAGSGSTFLTAPGGNIFDVEASSGANILLSHLTLEPPASGYGLFAQLSGSNVEISPDVGCIVPSGSAQACFYTEANAVIEIGEGETLKVQGSMAYAFQANAGGYIEMDPGGSGVFDCGTGLVAGTAVIGAQNGSKVLWYEGSLAANCSTATGNLFEVYGSSNVGLPGASVQPPGNGRVIIRDEGSTITGDGGRSPWTPTLGTCVNCTLDSHSTNYAISINFTGANTSVSVVFGAPPSPAAGYFSGVPLCFANTDVGGFAQGVQPAYFTSLGVSGFTVVPATGGSWQNGEILTVSCRSMSGG